MRCFYCCEKVDGKTYYDDDVARCPFSHMYLDTQGSLHVVNLEGFALCRILDEYTMNYVKNRITKKFLNQVYNKEGEYKF